MRSASGGGISGIVILVVLFFALKAGGIDPRPVLTGPDAGGVLTEDQRLPRRARKLEAMRWALLSR